jgi:hypothetical protein
MKATINWVAEGEAVLCVPERQGIEKGLRLVILELQRPAAAAVRRFVNARCRPVPDAEQPSDPTIQRFDITKVELLGAGHQAGLPRLTAIGGSGKGAFRSASPGSLLIHGAQAAKVGRGVALLSLPLSVKEI